MSHPYRDLPDSSFWSRAVANLPPFAIDPIIDAPFKISTQDKVATAGSCFAQHIARRLKNGGFCYYQPEQPPEDLNPTEALARQYGVYSCRYGNVYTTRSLLQLFNRAYDVFKPQIESWTRADGRLVDPFRPRVEPAGYADLDALRADRAVHLSAVRKMFETLDVFIFTFGLTEGWIHKADGAALPLAPGVAGGDDNPDEYAFWNCRFSDVVDDFLKFADQLRCVNPRARLIASVSPVPLAATMAPRHILVSNSASKAILRAAVDEICSSRENIAYFPSYDLITFGPNAAKFYDSSLREVTELGVNAAMRVFFDHFTESSTQSLRPTLKIDVARESVETAKIICDEEAIEAA